MMWTDDHEYDPNLITMRVLRLSATLVAIWNGMNSPTCQSRSWMQHLGKNKNGNIKTLSGVDPRKNYYL